MQELEARMGEPGFWDDQRAAAAIGAEHARLSRRLERYEHLTKEYEEARELFGLEEDATSEAGEAAEVRRLAG